MSIVTRAAQADMVRDMVRDPCTIRLYINEVGEEPTATDFVEVEGGEYGGKPIREAGWDLSNAPEEASYPQQTWLFKFEGPATLARSFVVHGYYITRNSDGRLRWFAPLTGGPMRIVNNGDEISVEVSLNFGQKQEADESTEAQA